MRSIQMLGMVVVIAVLAGCGPGKDDALAEYRVGDAVRAYTRGELYDQLGGNRESVLRNKDQQKSYVERNVFERLKAEEARAAGLDKEEEFERRLRTHQDERMLINNLLQYEFPRSNAEFSVPARAIRHIVVRIQDTREEFDAARYAEMEARIRKNTKEPEKLAEELAKLEAQKGKITKRVPLDAAGKLAQDRQAREKVEQALAGIEKAGKTPGAFAEAAAQYSEDGTATAGGFLGYFFPHQTGYDKIFTDAALALGPGEMSGVVKTQFGYHLIYCDEAFQMTDGNINDYYPNAAQRATLDKMEKPQREESLKQALQRKERDLGVIWRARVWAFIEEALAKDTEMLVQHRDRLGATDPQTVVFEVRHPAYQSTMTLGELDEAMKKMPPHALAQYGIARGVNDKRPFSAEEKEKYYDWQITFHVLRYGAFKRGVVERPEYRKELEKARETILAAMLTERKTAAITVTAEEVRAAYDADPKKHVRRERRQPPVPGQDPFTERQLGFAEARNKIEADLKNSRRQKLLQEWQAELFAKYQVRILEEAFEILPPPKPKDPPKPEEAKKK